MPLGSRLGTPPSCLMRSAIREEDHADDISDLLYTVDPKTGKTVEQFTGSVSKRFDS
jgi:hypothetical protein